MPVHNECSSGTNKNPGYQSRTKQDIKTLIATLSQAQDQKNKKATIKALEDIRGSSMLLLIQALSTEKWEVRSNALLTLEKVGKPATPVFLASLKDPDWFVRAAAAKALGQTEDPEAVSSLISILNDKEWFVRERAAEALSKIGEPAVEPLITALKDQNGLVRERAAEALSKIGEPAVEPLITALKDQNGLVRERAAEILGKIGSAKSVKPLLEAFHDRELYVRARAVLAFKQVSRRI